MADEKHHRHDQPVRHHRRAALRHEWRSQASERKQPGDPADDREDLEREHERQPGREQLAERLRTAQGRPQAARDDDAVDEDHRHQPHDAELLADRRGDEVTLREWGQARASEAPAAAEQAAVREAELSLDHLEVLVVVAERVEPRADAHADVGEALVGEPPSGGLLFAAGGWFAYQRFAYVGVRVSSWLDPFSNYDQNFQVIQGQFGFAYGGLLGRGWGLGRPGLTPLAKSDFITAAIGEELGVVGLMAVILVYGIIVARGLRTALNCTEPFGKLLSAGLSLVFALQVFAIIGGVTRLLPLTGLTTPFMSQGGSSMVANWLVMAVMLLVSHEARRPVAVRVDEGDVASLSADATQVIMLRPTQPVPRPEPRTAPSPALPHDDEPPARALPEFADAEATAALTPGDDTSISTVTRPITTDPDEPTQQYRFDQEEQ